ncbi:MAG: DUF6273 domain-containing protein [Clostridia bacterium]|nr:DUF6273 domain-containing protein [Clostridia bacterium]
MSLKQINKCPKCGGELKLNNGQYTCIHCNSVFIDNYIENNAKIIKSFLDELKIEKVAALRQRLWEQIHAKYLSSEEISSIAKEIRSILPEDFLAQFYEVACSKNKRDVVKFIKNIDYEKEYPYLDLVVEFMIRNLTSGNLLAVNNLIEKAYHEKNIELYYKYTTQLSKEAEKVSNGVYEVNIPREFFIAYSSSDIEKVEEITKHLEEQGFSCFVAMRNLRHGLGAVEQYNKALKKAIDNCKIFLFISSKNSRSYSCDALTKEMTYVKTKDTEIAPIDYIFNYSKIPNQYKKPRIQYRLDNEQTPVADKLVNEFFDGYQWCESLEALDERVANILYSTDTNKDKDDQKNEQLDSKNNEHKVDNRTDEEKKELSINSQIGDIVEFGSYPQIKQNKGFISEPIKWKILDIQNGEALLLSEKVLDCIPYQSDYEQSLRDDKCITKANNAPKGTFANNYQYSQIRYWLNNNFLNKAFTKEEQSKILVTTVDNSASSTGYSSNIYVCNNTNDKVYILSVNEISGNKYGFISDLTRQKKGTDYAKTQGLKLDEENNASYWLRSPNLEYSNSSAKVFSDGCIDNDDVDYIRCGVAPVIKIKL